jgi:hypothetical protein
MNEEVASKTVHLAIRVGKVTARTLYSGLKKFVDECKKEMAKQDAKRDQKKESKQEKTVRGKQSVKQLVGQGQGVSSLEVGDSGIRDFKRIANKYGVDFAIVKDKTEDPPRYVVFFKAKDVDAITQVLKEYSAMQMKRKQKAEKQKPSILEKLNLFKEKVKNTPRKDKEKRKEHER